MNGEADLRILAAASCFPKVLRERAEACGLGPGAAFSWLILVCRRLMGEEPGKWDHFNEFATIDS